MAASGNPTSSAPGRAAHPPNGHPSASRAGQRAGSRNQAAVRQRPQRPDQLTGGGPSLTGTSPGDARDARPETVVTVATQQRDDADLRHRAAPHPSTATTGKVRAPQLGPVTGEGQVYQLHDASVRAVGHPGEAQA